MVSNIIYMADEDICSYCYTAFRSSMQTTPYSSYNGFYEAELQYINTRCRTTFNTTIPTSLFPPDPKAPCDKENIYITQPGDTCDSIALKYSLSSAALFMNNPLSSTLNCKGWKPGTALCLPPSCATVHAIKEGEMCLQIEADNHDEHGTRYKDIVRFNPWIEPGCGNMWNSSENVYGHIICLAPQNGKHTLPGVKPAQEVGQKSDGYARVMVEVPNDAKVANGSTQRCGLWHTATKGDSCLQMTFGGPTSIEILMKVNPSLSNDTSQCTNHITPGLTYCIFPMFNWDYIIDTN